MEDALLQSFTQPLRNISLPKPKLAVRDQPDVSLHLEFLRQFEFADSVTQVTDIKAGSTTSTIQLLLLQKEKPKALAIVTSANFANPISPSAPPACSLYPAKLPTPILRRRWLTNLLMTGYHCWLTVRQFPCQTTTGHQLMGLVTAFTDDNMDATAIAYMAGNTIVAMNDVVLRSGSFMDAHRNHTLIRDWADKNPGVSYQIAHTFKEAIELPYFSCTVSMNVEFKKRLPREGVQWVYTRAETKMMEGGWLDMELLLMDKDMHLLCISRHMLQATGPRRKFQGGKSKPSL